MKEGSGRNTSYDNVTICRKEDNNHYEYFFIIFMRIFVYVLNIFVLLPLSPSYHVTCDNNN